MGSSEGSGERVREGGFGRESSGWKVREGMFGREEARS